MDVAGLTAAADHNSGMRRSKVLRIWYKALTQSYLDLTLRINAEVTSRIVERPGRWMPDPEIGKLLTELRSVAQRTLSMGDLEYGILTGTPDRLEKSIVTILYDRKSGNPIAFNALAVMDVSLHGKPTEVLHMGLVMIDPDVRSHGFSWVLYGFTCLVLFFRNQMRPLWLSNVTQVPAIVGMVAETFTNVFPSPKPGARRSFAHLLLARSIMANHRHVFGVGAEAAFDEQRFVVTNSYTGGSDHLKKTYETAPKHRNEVYNTFCARELDYDRGDDVLQLAQITTETARRFILRNVPSRSLPEILSTLAFVMLNRLILPVTYWLSADRQWGILRPWRPRKSSGPP
jgi:hypothetical protein